MAKKKKDDVTVVSIGIGSMSRDKLKKMNGPDDDGWRVMVRSTCILLKM